MSNIKRIKKLADRLHATARPKPAKIIFCLNDEDKKRAQDEFKKLPPETLKVMITTKDMSLPWPREKK